MTAITPYQQRSGQTDFRLRREAMLDWVITCYDDRAQEILDALEKKHGALLRCRVVSFWCGLTPNMLNRIICDVSYEADSGEGIIFLIGIAGALPYRTASLLGHRHSRYEVVSSVTLPLIEQMMVCRETMISSAFHEHIVEPGTPEVSNPWHQQQKSPPFVLKHNLCGY